MFKTLPKPRRLLDYSDLRGTAQLIVKQNFEFFIAGTRCKNAFYEKKVEPQCGYILQLVGQNLTSCALRAYVN
jgi:hypothetical protein